MFYDRAYFRRAWVMQEFAISKALVGLCGPMVVDMDVVMKVT